MEESLSKADIQGLLDFIERAKICEERNEFIALVDSLKQFFEFDSWVATLTSMNDLEKVTGFFTINTLPKLWLIEYVMKAYDQIDPIFMRNYNTKTLGKLQIWTDTYNEVLEGNDPGLMERQKKFIASSKKYSSMAEGMTLGCFNKLNRGGLVFSVCGERLKTSVRNQYILSSVSYYVDIAIKQVQDKELGLSLTEQQVKVLDLVQQGFTRGQIALQLDVSESTIKYHLDQAYHRLSADSQAHAVAKALSRGLIKHL